MFVTRPPCDGGRYFCLLRRTSTARPSGQSTASQLFTPEAPRTEQPSPRAAGAGSVTQIGRSAALSPPDDWFASGFGLACLGVSAESALPGVSVLGQFMMGLAAAAGQL